MKILGLGQLADLLLAQLEQLFEYLLVLLSSFLTRQKLPAVVFQEFVELIGHPINFTVELSADRHEEQLGVLLGHSISKSICQILSCVSESLISLLFVLFINWLSVIFMDILY